MRNKISKRIVLFSRKISNKGLFNYLVVGCLIFFSLILPISIRPAPSLLKTGDVAFQDIRAPRSFSYRSEYLTGLSQEEAEKSVAPVYLPADSSISRKQLEKLKSILIYISSIRNDAFASDNQKVEDIFRIDELDLTEDLSYSIIGLSDEDWNTVQSECLYLLDLVLRNTIREDQVSSMRRDLTTKIGFDFSEEEIAIINALVSPLITANSLFSHERTTTAIEEARSSVEPVFKSYQSGEIIVSNGEVISPLTWEALQALGYTAPKNRLYDYLSSGIFVVVLISFNFLYVRRLKKTRGRKIDGSASIVILFLAFLYIARWIIPNHVILPYLFPISAFGLTISSLFSYELGVIGIINLSLLTAFNLSNSNELAIFYLIPSLIGIFVLGRGRRITVFFIAGAAIALSGAGVIIAYRLVNSYLDMSGAITLIGASLINGFGSISLTLVIQYLLAQILGKTTALQLMDLARPDHPLLQEMLLNAPGSYQHSLQVANLAEQAAKIINCDALLTRVGALYHDVGKLLNPTFFIENQLPAQLDTHDNLDPAIASATIMQHVEDGIKLAKKYHLPPQIQSFIAEHHGTTQTRYQYNLALSKKSSGAKNINEKLFCYPGPHPKTKETALLMLADGCEARVRAESPRTEEEISAIIESNFDYYLSSGQLNHADLTLKDLSAIKNSFIKTFQNVYHQRIKYPQLK